MLIYPSEDKLTNCYDSPPDFYYLDDSDSTKPIYRKCNEAYKSCNRPAKTVYEKSNINCIECKKRRYQLL